MEQCYEYRPKPNERLRVFKSGDSFVIKNVFLYVTSDLSSLDYRYWGNPVVTRNLRDGRVLMLFEDSFSMSLEAAAFLSETIFDITDHELRKMMNARITSIDLFAENEMLYALLNSQKQIFSEEIEKEKMKRCIRCRNRITMD